MKKEADIESIQSWLDSIGTPYTESNLSDKSEWPPAIRRLEPRFVTIRVLEGKKVYARLVWGTGLLGRWGLVVGAKEKEIQLNDFCASEYRIELDHNSFVWYGLNRPTEKESNLKAK